MTVRAVVAVALLCVAGPIAAQDQSVPVAPAVVAEGLAPPPTATKPAWHLVPPDWSRLEAAAARARFVTSGVQSAAAPRKRSKAPIVGGMVLGGVLGFLGGNYVQHSVCEFDCPPGGFTWGFTAIGAAGGAAIGWLIRG